jgi:hypothetical protein
LLSNIFKGTTRKKNLVFPVPFETLKENLTINFKTPSDTVTEWKPGDCMNIIRGEDKTVDDLHRFFEKDKNGFLNNDPNVNHHNQSREHNKTYTDLVLEIGQLEEKQYFGTISICYYVRSVRGVSFLSKERYEHMIQTQGPDEIKIALIDGLNRVNAALYANQTRHANQGEGESILNKIVFQTENCFPKKDNDDESFQEAAKMYSKQIMERGLNRTGHSIVDELISYYRRWKVEDNGKNDKKDASRFYDFLQKNRVDSRLSEHFSETNLEKFHNSNNRDWATRLKNAFDTNTVTAQTRDNMLYFHSAYMYMALLHGKDRGIDEKILDCLDELNHLINLEKLCKSTYIYGDRSVCFFIVTHVAIVSNINSHDCFSYAVHN